MVYQSMLDHLIHSGLLLFQWDTKTNYKRYIKRESKKKKKKIYIEKKEEEEKEKRTSFMTVDRGLCILT